MQAALPPDNTHLAIAANILAYAIRKKRAGQRHAYLKHADGTQILVSTRVYQMNQISNRRYCRYTGIASNVSGGALEFCLNGILLLNKPKAPAIQMQADNTKSIS